jgi:hypothetical protein
MADVRTVQAAEFSRNFGRYQAEAIGTGLVVVMDGDRVVGGYLSDSELARYQKLRAREREVLIVGELGHDVVADIQAAEHGVEAQ